MDTTTAPIVEDRSVDHVDDVAAITALVRDVETGFNANDAELMVRPFIRNGSAVSVNGTQVDGIDDILEVSRAGLAGFLRDQRSRYELTDLTFLRSDIAVGHKRAWAVDPGGEEIDVGHAMNALYVFVKEDGRWWVASRQNTLVTRPA